MKVIRNMGVSLALGLAAAACDTGPQFSSTVTRKVTVSLGTEDTVVVNAPVSIELLGSRGRSALEVELELTVTASSADTAERAAKGVKVAVSRRDREVVLGVGGIDEQRVQGVSGTYTINAPRDLNARVTGTGKSVSVENLEGSVEVEAATNARVLGAEDSVSIQVGRGNAIVDTRARPGTSTAVMVQIGSVEIRLPTPLNARVVARAEGGALVVNHPDLRRPLAGFPYDVVAGSGLASVTAVTRAGNVVLRQP